MIPSVTVLFNPKGFPITNTFCPTSYFSVFFTNPPVKLYPLVDFKIATSFVESVSILKVPSNYLPLK